MRRTTPRPSRRRRRSVAGRVRRCADRAGAVRRTPGADAAGRSPMKTISAATGKKATRPAPASTIDALEVLATRPSRRCSRGGAGRSSVLRRRGDPGRRLRAPGAAAPGLRPLRRRQPG